MAEEHRSLTKLGESERARAMERFTLIRSCLQEDVPLSTLAREHGLDRSTLYRWISRYNDEGLMGLAKRERVDKGRHNIPQELVLLIEGLALERPGAHPGSSRQHASRDIARPCLGADEALGIPNT